MDTKKTLFSLLMLILLQTISGQDIIITIKKDTIHCSILSVTLTQIHYEQIAENGFVSGKFIPTEQVLEYFRTSQLEKNNYAGSSNSSNKHYFGYNIAHGVGKYKENKKWNLDYIGMGFDYAYCLDDADVGIGLEFSYFTNLNIALPIKLKKNIGKHFFVGVGIMAVFEQGENTGICASAMTGLEYVFESGLSLSLNPSLRYSIMNIKVDNPMPDILQHAIISLGLGYRFNHQISQLSKNNTYYWIDRQKPKPSHRWMVGIQTGGSLLLASTTDSEENLTYMGMSILQAEDYYKQQKRGWHLNGDLYYLLFDNFGLGARYSFFTSSAHKDFLVRNHNDVLPSFINVSLNEKQYINYAGPSVFFRQWLDKNKNFQMTGTFSIGYVHYRDEIRLDATFNLDNALVEGKTWGTTYGISFDYFPISWLSVGINAGFIYSRLTKLDISDKEKTQSIYLPNTYYRHLSRLDCSLGMRFHF